MNMNQLESKMLCSPFIMFTNSHPDFGQNLTEEEVSTSLDGIGLKYMFISSVNAAGRPMNYFLVPTLGVTITERYDLDVLIEDVLEQRFTVCCTNAMTYLVKDLENVSIVAVTGKIEFMNELPENNYYVTPMGQAFTFPFDLITTKGK